MCRSPCVPLDRRIKKRPSRLVLVQRLCSVCCLPARAAAIARARCMHPKHPRRRLPHRSPAARPTELSAPVVAAAEHNRYVATNSSCPEQSTQPALWRVARFVPPLPYVPVPSHARASQAHYRTFAFARCRRCRFRSPHSSTPGAACGSLAAGACTKWAMGRYSRVGNGCTQHVAFCTDWHAAR